MGKRYWVTGAIKKEHQVRVFGYTCNIDMSWAPGQVGVLPVFNNKKAALKYIEGTDISLIAVEEVDKG